VTAAQDSVADGATNQRSRRTLHRVLPPIVGVVVSLSGPAAGQEQRKRQRHPKRGMPEESPESCVASKSSLWACRLRAWRLQHKGGLVCPWRARKWRHHKSRVDASDCRTLWCGWRHANGPTDM